MAVVVKIPFWHPILGEVNSPPMLEPILVLDWDVHWGYDLGFEKPMATSLLHCLPGYAPDDSV